MWNGTAAGLGIGPPMATSRGFLGEDVSNNVAEYAGLRECMLRAARCLDEDALFEVDSMLLARQVARYRPWACRSASLLELHAECVELGERMNVAGIDWDIRHIYREYNQVADALSNQAIDDQGTNGASDNW